MTSFSKCGCGRFAVLGSAGCDHDCRACIGKGAGDPLADTLASMGIHDEIWTHTATAVIKLEDSWRGRMERTVAMLKSQELFMPTQSASGWLESTYGNNTTSLKFGIAEGGILFSLSNFELGASPLDASYVESGPPGGWG